MTDPLDVQKQVAVFVDAWTAPIVDRNAANVELCLIIRQAEQAAREKALEKLLYVVSSQALDPGLWFEAKTAPEAYLQQALRALHEEIEGVSAEECAIRALKEKP